MANDFVDMIAGGLPYDSTSMKTGVRLPILLKHQRILRELVRLDPRGGFFSQNMMAGAVRTLIATNPEAAAAMKALSAALCQPVDIATQRLAYNVRVMLAHTRANVTKWSRPKSKEEHVHFQEIQDMLRNRASPQKFAHHPFPNFRDADEEEGDDESDPHEEPVGTYFDGFLMKPFQLLPDGSMIDPLWCEYGKHGFVMAMFEGGVSLDTEIPNRCYKDGVFTKPEPETPQPPKCKKRPAAAGEKDIVKSLKMGAHAGDDDTDGEDGEDAEQKTPSKSRQRRLTVKLKKGNGGKVCIFIATTDKNKVQVLEMDDGEHKEEILQLATKTVLDSLKPYPGLSPKDIPKEILKEVRAKLRKIRGDVMA